MNPAQPTHCSYIHSLNENQDLETPKTLLLTLRLSFRLDRRSVSNNSLVFPSLILIQEPGAFICAIRAMLWGIEPARIGSYHKLVEV